MTENNTSAIFDRDDDCSYQSILNVHALTGGEVYLERTNGSSPHTTRPTRYKRSYVNDAVEVLRAAGRPLKLQELQTQIGVRRGKTVSLGSLKVCLSRYVDSSDSSKQLARLAPGLFALNGWDGVKLSNGRHVSEFRIARVNESSETFLKTYLWKLPAQFEGAVEQQVYLLAESEADAYLRLANAGVLYSKQGNVQPVDAPG